MVGISYRLLVAQAERCYYQETVGFKLDSYRLDWRQLEARVWNQKDNGWMSEYQVGNSWIQAYRLD